MTKLLFNSSSHLENLFGFSFITKLLVNLRVEDDMLVEDPYFSWPYLSTQKADLQAINLYFDLWWKLSHSPNIIKKENHNGRSNSLRHSYGVPRDSIVPVNTERAIDDCVYWHSEILINSTPNNKRRIVLVSIIKGFSLFSLN